MDSNLQATLFYTLSTVAQTLAGAMGLLGAIVLFALQETSRSTARAAEKLADIPHDSMSALYLHHLLTRRSYHELARHYGDLLGGGGSSSTSSDALVHYSTLMWELDHDHTLRRSFWTALLSSGVMISFALTCCAIAPQLAANHMVGYVVLGTATVGALACLVLYGFLLRVMIRATPAEPIPAVAPSSGRPA